MAAGAWGATTGARRAPGRARWIAGALGLALLGGGAPGARADDAATATAALAEADALEAEVDRASRSGANDRAIALTEKVLAIREQRLGPSDPKVATSLSDLGALYLMGGDPRRAEPLLTRAVAILEAASPAPPRALGMALYHLAAFHQNRGDLTQAVTLTERAIKLLEGAGPEAEDELAACLRMLAFSIITHGSNKARSIKLLERALDIHKAHKKFDSAVRVLTDLGHLEREGGEAGRAARRYEEALDLAEKNLPPDHPATGTLLYRIGRALHRDRSYAEAERYYQRASTIIEAGNGPNHPFNAIFLADWSLLCEAAGDIPRSIELRARSNEIEDQHLDRLLAAGDELDRKMYAVQVQRHLEDTISLHTVHAQGDPRALRLALTTILRRKARVLDALADDMATLRERAGPEERRLLDDLARTRSSLGTLLLRSSDVDLRAHRAELLALVGEEKRLEAAIGARSETLRAATSPVTIEAIQAAIPEGAALVELVRYQPHDARAYSEQGARLGAPRYIAYVLPRAGEPRWTHVPVDAADVEVVTQQVRARIQDPVHPSVYDAAERLDHLLMRRVNDLLGDARHVLISPDGALNLLPFGALVEDGHFLVERFAFTYLTSGRDLLRARPSRATQSAPVIFANPTYDKADAPPAAPSTGRGVKKSPPWMHHRDQEEAPPEVDPAMVSYPRLPGTEAEARAILKVIPGAVLRHGPEATEAALKAVAGPKLLHVATHGFFFGKLTNAAAKDVPDPLLRSGLALAGANLHSARGEDGILTALEASTLDLFGTEVVVLSACETGMGDVQQGEGVRGLRRALILAGAETQVMSLWKVDDQATRDLMTAYYDELVRKGRGRSEALQKAQLALLGRKSTRHPFYWASFITSGASGPLRPDDRWTRPPPPAVAPGPRGCSCSVPAAEQDDLPGWGVVALLLLAFGRRQRALGARRR